MKKFFYSPSSRYCAIVAASKEKIDEVRRLILEHYLGDSKAYNSKQIIVAKNGSKMAGQLIHLTHNIASKIRSQNQFKGIDLEMCPEDFEKSKARKSGLMRLVNRFS